MTAALDVTSELLSVDPTRLRQSRAGVLEGRVQQLRVGRYLDKGVPVGQAAVDAIPAAVKRSGWDCAEPQRDALPAPLAQE